MKKEKAYTSNVLKAGILVLASVSTTYGICKMDMNNKLNVLKEDLNRMEKKNVSYKDMIEDLRAFSYQQEKLYVTERDRSRKLEEQLKKCCPDYSVED